MGFAVGMSNYAYKIRNKHSIRITDQIINRVRRLGILFIVLVVALVAELLLSEGYPLVIRSGEVIQRDAHHQDSAVVNPLAGANLDQGEWTVYLILDRDDFADLTPALEPYKVWKLNAVSVLEQMQHDWNFIPTGGDMATVTSELIVVHDGNVVFEAGIILDQKVIGLQGQVFGWAEGTDQAKMIAILKAFREVRYPFVFI